MAYAMVCTFYAINCKRNFRFLTTGIRSDKQVLDCYLWRHGSIFLKMNEHLKAKLANSFRIYVDSLHLRFSSLKGIFCGKIPDIVLQQGKNVIFIERTSPAETKLIVIKEPKNLSLILCNELELFYLIFQL